jgi:hypothetical protein
MNITERHTEGQAPRSPQGQPPYQRAMTVGVTFVLATAFAFATVPTVTAFTNYPAHKLTVSSDSVRLPISDGVQCGDAPGTCRMP